MPSRSSTTTAPASRAARSAPRAFRAAAAGGLGLGAAGGLVWLLAPGAEPLWQALLGLAVLVPFAIAVGRGLSSGRETMAWASVGCGLVLTGVAAQHGMPSGHTAPSAEIGAGDVLWLARYPLLYGALAALVLARSPKFGIRAALDGLVGAFAAGGVYELVGRPWVTEGLPAGDAVVMLRASYPLLDVLVLGFLAGAAVLNAWPARTWVPLVLDIGFFTAGEVLDVRMMLQNPGEPLGWTHQPVYLLSGWFLAAAIFALQESRRPTRLAHRPIWPSILLGGTAVVTLAATDSDTQRLATVIPALALLAALARQWLTHCDNERLLAASQEEALTDALTGLGNRRALMTDLADAVRGATTQRPLTLALYDLDGFKNYNDTFGHPAGDALLQRLGAALDAAIRPAGRAYRMGGDEFCILASGTYDHSVLVAAGRRALADHGEGFSIGASAGVATAPSDAQDPMEILRLADHRMYAEKGAGRASRTSDLNATAALLQVVRERDPLLGEHTAEVASWAADVAAALGADAETIELARLGGELHDIGKTAIPDAILNKPGPLDDGEWTFMRRHTIIGERILLADPAIAAAAPIARSHHERWDGGGYPDGLAGSRIPLVARIVCVCDAYEAMVADRAYRPGCSHEEAIGELIRCRGTQFDPDVVDAFIEVVAPRGRFSARGAAARAC